MNFFSADPISMIQKPYDSMHTGFLVFFFVSIILVIVLRNKIAGWKYEKHLRYGITILAIIFETGFRLWKHFAQHMPIVEVNLPLHLCSISLTLAWVLMLFKKEWAFKLVYFYAFGALISVLVGDSGGFGLNHFRFYQYFYIHGYIVFTAVYFAAVHKYKITFKNLLESTGVLLGIFIVVMPIDYFFGANYMYLMAKPDIALSLEWMGSWPGYILTMTMLAVGIFTVAYIPWFFVNWKNRRNAGSIQEAEKIAA